MRHRHKAKPRLNLLFATSWGLLILTVLPLCGCYIKASVQCTQGTCLASTSHETVYLGVKGGLDTISDNYLVDEVAPVIEFSALRPLSSMTATVFSSSATEACPAQNVSGKSFTLTSCALPDGDYQLRINYIDVNGVAGAWEHPFTKSVLRSPGNLWLYAGESISLLPTTGVPFYTTTDQSFGFLNPISLLYTFPLGSSPSLEAIQIKDSKDRTVNFTMKGRTFLGAEVLSSEQTAIRGITKGLHFTRHKGTLYMAGEYENFAGNWNVGIVTSVSASRRSGGIWASADNGNTWIFKASLRSNKSSDTRTQVRKIFSDGITLYAVVTSQDTGATGEWTTGKYWSIFRSVNDGDTWEEIGIYIKNNLAFYDAIFLGDQILLGGSYRQAGIGTHTLVVRCNFTSKQCLSVEERGPAIGDLTTNTTMTVGFAKDSSGKIYKADGFDDYVFGASPVGITSWKIFVSPDQGNTWSLKGTAVSTATGMTTKLQSFAVSSDGNHMIAGGFIASAGGIFESLDGGTTWTVFNRVCGNSASSVETVFFDENDNAVVSCYGYYFPNQKWYIAKRPAAGTWSSIEVESSVSARKRILTYVGGGEVIAPSIDISIRRNTNYTMGPWIDLAAPMNENLSDKFLAHLNYVYQSDGATGPLFALGKRALAAIDTYQPVLLKSVDRGQTWNVEDTEAFGSFQRIAHSTNTNTLIAGGTMESSSWLLRRKASIGSWSIPGGAYPTSPLASQVTTQEILTTDNGDFFALGTIKLTANNKQAWAILKSTDDGVSWSEVLPSYSYTANQDSRINASLFTKEAGADILYVVGYGGITGSNGHWLVRRWDGTTWTDSDTWLGESGRSFEAMDITIDADKTLWVVGTYIDSGGISHGVLRKKPIGGNWVQVTDYQMTSARPSAFHTVIVDSRQNIVVGGYGADENWRQLGIVRIYRPDGSTFLVDQYRNSFNGTVKSIAPCLGDRLCITGDTADLLGLNRGFVRILSE